MNSKTNLATSLVFAVLLSLPLACLADEIHGRVVKITDGDTVHVLDVAQERHKIRLAGIDCPERKQPFGQKAKEHLSSMVAGQDVVVDWHKRVVGTIIHQGKDVNLRMVRDGMWWWYRKYADEQTPGDRALYQAAENQAKAERRGLWVDSEPMPPWEWRRQ